MTDHTSSSRSDSGDGGGNGKEYDTSPPLTAEELADREAAKLASVEERRLSALSAQMEREYELNYPELPPHPAPPGCRDSTSNQACKTPLATIPPSKLLYSGKRLRQKGAKA